MICSHCGANNDENAVFCGQCGERLMPEPEPTIVAEPKRRKSAGDDLWGEDSWEAEQKPWIVSVDEPNSELEIFPEPEKTGSPCILCGEMIPPGEDVCPSCGAKVEDDEENSLWQEFSDVAPVNTNTDEWGGDEDELQTVILRSPVVTIRREKTGDQTTIKVFPVTIGRSSRSGWQVKGNPAIGREHVRLSCEGEDVYLEDLESRNHTFVPAVNGPAEVRIDAQVRIRDGMRIRMADEYFVINVEMV